MKFVTVDIEVFAYDWVVVFKDYDTKVRAIYHNDNDGVKEYLAQEDIIYIGANIKHYDQFIIKAIALDFTPQECKTLNDFIIKYEGNGWEYQPFNGRYFQIDVCDIFDDMQIGLSLKAIEAHLGMDIEETQVDFDIDRPLTEDELEKTIFYCSYDVDAAEKIFDIRKDYFKNKLTLGRVKNIPDPKALYMTNAKLTAAYLDAHPAEEYADEREYQYPANLLRQYIPGIVFEFFDRIHDPSISDEELFTSKLNFSIGDCQVTLGFGGIHGAIPTYRERATGKRSIRNRDVASYYPHLMTLDGYCSRSIPNPKIYADMLETRIQAKRSGDKATANALKLVANTTYGAMLNRYNDLFDPLMGRSVCITGQLRLLELTNHLVAECPTIKIVQLNTDGIMVSLDDDDLDAYNAICQEWQDRTGFELEEDCIAEIIQKDVNNYVEIATDGSTKIKGGQLVRGIAPAGAFNINENMRIVAQALLDYFAKGVPVADTINECNEPLMFQLVAKAGSKYSGAFHYINGEKIPVQRVNRVYASVHRHYGTLVRVHAEKGNDNKISGLPEHCIVDNRNTITIEEIDKAWYIKMAENYVKDFLGKSRKIKRTNTRKINTHKRNILKFLEE